MTIKYQNINEKSITVEQVNELSEYYKVYIDNGIINKKEFFMDNELSHINHYKKDFETEIDLINMYSNAGVFYSIIESSSTGNNVIESIKEFSGTNLKNHSRFLRDQNNNILCEEHIDLLTGQPKYEETEKYFYDFDKEDYFPIITATYNEDGSLDVIQYDSYRFDGQDEIVFSEDGTPGVNDLTTLMSLLGISSQQMDYYLNATL